LLDARQSLGYFSQAADIKRKISDETSDEAA
jgi:hypothetical protein